MDLDSRPIEATTCVLAVARAPPIFWNAPRDSYESPPEITIKLARGGFRANATGGLRSPPGGRPRKADPEQPADIIPDPIERWYCVRSAFNQERDADRSVRLDGFEVFNPSIYARATPPRPDSNGVMRPGKPDRVSPLLGRYFFVRFNIADPHWYQIKRLPGVECVMSGADLDAGGSASPTAIPDRAIEWLRSTLDSNGCYYPEKFRHKKIQPGTLLRFLDGPFADLTGTCEASDGLEVRLSVLLMGHLVPVTAPQNGIELV